MSLNDIKKAYFIGIKGAGMVALAQIFRDRGIEVLGSDVHEKFFTDEVLKRLKLKVIEGFDGKNVVPDADIVVVSVAYLGKGVQNPEVKEARKLNLPIYTYPQALAMLFDDKYGIAVAGTHGKSTITAMLGVALENAGLDPTVVVGTKLLQWQSNARTGNSKYLIVETCEYRSNFLQYSPKALVLTSIDYDHPDFFKSFKEYKEAFRQLVHKIPASGFIVANGEDEHVQDVVKEASCRVVNYSLNQSDLKLQVPGKHNLLNASAVRTVARELGADDALIKEGLNNYQGISRRLEVKSEKDGILLIDDYAHHPTEIKASLEAIKSLYPHKKIWAVFQPHTFTRTKVLLKDFGSAFTQADEVIILDIYGSAREKAGGVHSRDLTKKIEAHGDKVKYLSTIKEAGKHLRKEIKSNQVVLTMGAGDVWRVLEFLK